PSWLQLESAAPVWLEADWRLDGSGSLDEDGLFRIDTLALDSEAGGLDASGSYHLESYGHDLRIALRAHDLYSLPGVPDTLADTPVQIQLAAIGGESNSQIDVALST